MKEKKLFLLKLQILSYQNIEFHKFFWAINCFSYKTHGFHKLFEFSQNFALFLFHLFLSKNAKFCEKICEMWPKIFAFFRETFCLLKTLVIVHLI